MKTLVIIETRGNKTLSQEVISKLAADDIKVQVVSEVSDKTIPSDIIDKNDYAVIKALGKEDIEDFLSEKGYEATDELVNRIMKSPQLKYLEESHDIDRDIIYQVIEEEIKKPPELFAVNIIANSDTFISEAAGFTNGYHVTVERIKMAFGFDSAEITLYDECERAVLVNKPNTFYGDYKLQYNGVTYNVSVKNAKKVSKQVVATFDVNNEALEESEQGNIEDAFGWLTDSGLNLIDMRVCYDGEKLPNIRE